MLFVLSFVIAALLLARAGLAQAGLPSSAWTLSALRGSPVEGGPRAAHLVFNADGVSGSTGCNRFSGSYELDGEALRFGPVAATRMACESGARELERAFVDMLAEVAGWRASDDRLELLGADDGVLATFEAGAPQ
jgi:heat shock protein HslJ